MEGGYGEDLVDVYLERVPHELLFHFWESRPGEGGQIGAALSRIDVPMLIAEHRGCLLFTSEGFEDAAAALPATRAIRLDDKPSTSPEFARALHAFCTEQVPASA